MKRLNRVLVMSLLLAAPALAAPVAPAPAAADGVETKVRRLLSAYEPVDLAQALRALGNPTAVAEALLRLAHDPGAGIAQLRAVEGLGHVPTEAGRLYLRELVVKLGDARDYRSFFLAAAVRGLGGFGERELDTVAPLLGHPSPDVREAAAAAMRSMPAALPLLQKRLATEPDQAVQAALSHSVEALARSARAVRK